MPGEQEDFLSTLGRMAASFQIAPQGVSGRIWDELRPWFGRLALNAAPKWLPRLGFGFACAVPVYQHGRPVGACPHNAVNACTGCDEPCCLNHAFTDQFGEVVCYLCVASLRRRRSATPPPAEKEQAAVDPSAPTDKELAWARRLLSVKKSADWDEVRAAHRRLSAKWHPDLHSTPAAKARAEEKFKDVQRARDLLQRDYDEREAA